MKNSSTSTPSRRTLITALSMSVLAPVAVMTGPAGWAAGTHAGGHGHGSHAADGSTPYGKPGVAAKASRTIKIDAADSMRFTPSELRVKRGETIRFVVTNVGKVKHEFSLGTRKDLEEHYEMMKKFPDMEHDEPNSVSLAPGATREVVWQFTRPGVVEFACLHVGHFDAGMHGKILVTR